MYTLKTIIVLLVIFILSVNSKNELPQDLTKAFSFAENLSSAYVEAKLQLKPIMLIIHTTNCLACVELRPKMIGSDELRELSAQFIMVNDLDREDLLAEQIAPDGLDYSPRIIFFGCDGTVLEHIFNLNRSIYKYYYRNDSEVIVAMKKAIEVNREIRDSLDQNPEL